MLISQNNLAGVTVPIAVVIARVAARAIEPVTGRASAVLRVIICIVHSATRPALGRSIARPDRKPNRGPPPTVPIMFTLIVTATCIAIRKRAGNNGPIKAGVRKRRKTNRRFRKAVNNKSKRLPSKNRKNPALALIDNS